MKIRIEDCRARITDVYDLVIGEVYLARYDNREDYAVRINSEQVLILSDDHLSKIYDAIPAVYEIESDFFEEEKISFEYMEQMELNISIATKCED